MSGATRFVPEGWLRRSRWTCLTCSALVRRDDRQGHAEWHANPNRPPDPGHYTWNGRGSEISETFHAYWPRPSTSRPGG